VLQKGGLLYYATITIAISVIGHNEVEVIHVLCGFSDIFETVYLCTMCVLCVTVFCVCRVG
jgi:hypothetical protein